MGALVIPVLGLDELPCPRDPPALGVGRATPPLGVRDTAPVPVPLFVDLTEGDAPEFRTALPAEGAFRGEEVPVPALGKARSEGLVGAPAAGLPWAPWAEGLPLPARA